ncbi:histone deacetylase complex protein [Crepidotus variabilis]|uniref:Histone deacetylase complex protein n=1 Tax=Crepidotus variabilis TaxID=179855 RepID=A0A9P6EBA5_9AGAR|nr:histone deacetylase complex protein [Crepidotus variabilis]
MASSPDNSTTGVFIQNACLQHKYIRSKDLSAIVERPERLRAINIGLSAAISRLDELLQPSVDATEDIAQTKPSADPNDLADELNRLSIAKSSSSHLKAPISLIHSDATVDLLNNPSVKFVHGDIDRDVYLENLKSWAKDSVDKIGKGESEIPQGLAQGDLYLCPSSMNAIEGAVGTVCEAVDKVVLSNQMEGALPTMKRAFVAVRPPGHHCGEDTPAGFCFVNNVAIGAAHAHLKHGIKRIVILDIDLHHGNGTQSITMQINEETYRQTLESEGAAPTSKTGPEVFYGSIHDILSYPCEDGKLDLIQAASVSIHKSHGQYIENVHLQTYTSEDHFWNVLYKQEYSKILTKAREFLDHTGGPGDDVLFFISCGMDACEHEYDSMSRHNRKVPTSFYYRFARDTCALSDEYAKGRVISVLEGGYSDRALISGAMAHLSGLVNVPKITEVDENWWSLDNLVKLEHATKKRRGGRASLPAQGSTEPWLERAVNIFTPLDVAASQAAASAPKTTVPTATSSRTLRDRTKGKPDGNVAVSSSSTNASPNSSPSSKRTKPRTSTAAPTSTTLKGAGIPVSKAITPPKTVILKLGSPAVATTTPGRLSDGGNSPSTSPASSEGEVSAVEKKLPKVVLKLGRPPSMTS